MKICRISQTFPTKKRNGIGLHTYFVSNIVKIPTLILTKYTDEEYISYGEHIDLKPVKYAQKAFPANNKLTWAFFSAAFFYIIGQLEFTFKSIRALIDFKPDIIHLQSPHAILIGIFGKVFLGSKLVLTFHGSDLLRIKNNKIYFRMLKLCDRIYYVSPPMKNLLLKHIDEKTLFEVHSGVDLKSYKKADQIDKEKIILSVGNLRWQKGYEYLINAFAKVNKKQPAYKLLIIGEGSERVLLENLIDRLNLKDRVFLLGYKSKEDVINYMQKSSVYALSSVTEGMPKVLLEAMACGLPIVATDVGAIKMMMGDSAIVVPHSDSDLLANAIINLITSPEKREIIKNEGLVKVKSYSWENLADTIRKDFNYLMTT